MQGDVSGLLHCSSAAARGGHDGLSFYVGGTYAFLANPSEPKYTMRCSGCMDLGRFFFISSSSSSISIHYLRCARAPPAFVPIKLAEIYHKSPSYRRDGCLVSYQVLLQKLMTTKLGKRKDNFRWISHAYFVMQARPSIIYTKLATP